MGFEFFTFCGMECYTVNKNKNKNSREIETTCLIYFLWIHYIKPIVIFKPCTCVLGDEWTQSQYGQKLSQPQRVAPASPEESLLCCELRVASCPLAKQYQLPQSSVTQTCRLSLCRCVLSSRDGSISRTLVSPRNPVVLTVLSVNGHSLEPFLPMCWLCTEQSDTII